MPSEDEHNARVPIFVCPECQDRFPAMTYAEFQKIYELSEGQSQMNQTAREYADTLSMALIRRISEHEASCPGWIERRKTVAKALPEVIRKVIEMGENMPEGATQAVLMVAEADGSVKVVEQETIHKGKLDS